jgi:XTP/dITP diphosphohydrolase
MKALFATGNPGKFKEVKAVFSKYGIELERLDDEYPEIQSDTLEDVVDWGLGWLWERHRRPIIIDDSGLFVRSLGGFPGVFSAYVFMSIGCEGIIKLLEGEEDRSAAFRCCAGFSAQDGRKTIVIGSAEGCIIDEKRGTGGFGYDPVFVPEGEQRTFAQMTLEEKNSMSHRGRAFAKLAEVLKRNPE